MSSNVAVLLSPRNFSRIEREPFSSGGKLPNAQLTCTASCPKEALPSLGCTTSLTPRISLQGMGWDQDVYERVITSHTLVHRSAIEPIALSAAHPRARFVGKAYSSWFDTEVHRNDCDLV